MNIRNTIIANNAALNGPDCLSLSTDLNSQDYNLIEDATDCNITGTTTNNITGQDPLLSPLASNGGPSQTHELLMGSPALEAGDDANCAATDQRGYPRSQDGDGNGTATCDIGAFERLPPPKTFRSMGAHDGWVLESTETSGVGGSLNSAATTFRLGDEAVDQQYRAILCFDTSFLPDTAVITKVTLKIKKQGVTGTNPFTTHQFVYIDIRKGSFSNNAALQLADFKAAASKNSVGKILNNPVGSLYSSVLSSMAHSRVNPLGMTQLRLRFKLDDNNDNGADYMKFYSGNAGASYRPQLIVEYYTP